MADKPTRNAGSTQPEGSEHSAPVRNKTVHTALISGANFRGKAVQYVALDGLAMFEGDIVLGTVEEVEAETEVLRAELTGAVAAAVLITGNQFRWPNCVVPYTIDSALTNQARVTDAIKHWEANTRFTFVLRTAANEASYPDWVTFRPGSGCSSSVGKRGGQQFVNLAAGCTTGNTIHEIGHAVGLWHEQSREDRDSFVTIAWANILSGTEHNFNQHITDGDDVGGYDYGSIMHYPRDAFTKNGMDTIVPTDPTASIGQRTGLSAGDIAAANSMCPIVKLPVETFIETLKEKVETSKELETLKEHTKEKIETLKELSPETFKEQSPETKKELVPETKKELVPETLKELAPETAKELVGETRKELVETIQENVTLPGGGVVVNPGFGDAGLPFAMATPYAAEQQAVAQQLPTASPCGCYQEATSLEARVAALEEVVAVLAAQHDAVVQAYGQGLQ